MKKKEYYLEALVEDKGRSNEIEIGERLGFSVEETQEILVNLLAEHKIAFTPNGFCQYSPVKKQR